MYIVADIIRNCNIFFKYFLENPQLFAENSHHSMFLDKKIHFSRKCFHNLPILTKSSLSFLLAKFRVAKQLHEKRTGKNKERKRA